MDDRELEARLSARLHRRFDRAEPSARLVAAVVPVTDVPAPRPTLTLGRGLAAAAIVVLVVAAAALSGRLPSSGGTATSSPSPIATFAVLDRQYLVLPPVGSVPTKAETSAAGIVLDARLRALGIGTFSSGAGYAITYRLPLDVEDAAVRAVLGSSGSIRLAAVPGGDSGPTDTRVEPGKRLPDGMDVLFDERGIASAAFDPAGQGGPALTLTLTAPAKDALAAHTSEHVGEFLALALDGTVVLLARISEPLVDGSIVLGSGSEDATALRSVFAVVESGTLPPAWAHPIVPRTIDPEAAARRAFDATTWSQVRVSVVSAELGTAGDDVGSDRFLPVWRVVVHGSFPPGSCGPRVAPPATQPPCPSPADSALVIVAAGSGEVLVIQTPAP